MNIGRGLWIALVPAGSRRVQDHQRSRQLAEAESSGIGATSGVPIVRSLTYNQADLEHHAGMDRVPVYAFTYFDRESGEWKRAPDFATEDAIREMAANILPDSIQEVERQQVSRSGLVQRPRL